MNRDPRAKSRRKARSAQAAGKSQAVTPPQPAYPRPLLERRDWTSLDGLWEFSLDADGQRDSPRQVRWHMGTIRVPFAPETPASGAGEDGRGMSGLFRRCWYRRTFAAPPPDAGHRVLLHFEAVDYLARVWVNGQLAAEHEGGYTPFSVDVTSLLRREGEQQVVVCADDDPVDMCKPRGKQDWHEQAHSIWYPRTTGIWQSVWMELVPAVRIESLLWTPKLAQGEVRLEARIAGPRPAEHRLRVTLSHAGRILCDDICSIGTGGEVRRSFPVSLAGAEDFAIDLLWSPEHPRLIDAELRLLGPRSEVIDEVRSYTALREVGVDGDRFLLNRRPRTLKLVLNQGYWPESGMTPPDDNALQRDVELVKALGFDGVRMHQKIESRRFLSWADRLGLLVWEEMPSAYAFSPATVRRAARQWAEAIERDASHPCIIAWVPINESWGAPDLPTDSAQRAFVAAMYNLTRSLDPTRPVVGNDGWEIEHSDLICIHDYDDDPGRLAARYAASTQQEVLALLSRERPGHRRLLLEGCASSERPLMLSEFGGIAWSSRAGDWGYSRAKSASEFLRRFTDLMAAVRSIPKLAGFCYTQFADTYQEANGLLDMERRAKVDVAKLRAAVLGSR